MDSLSESNLNIRMFWKLSKRILDDKSERTIPRALENNVLVPDDARKAELFNNHFASIASSDQSKPLPRLPNFQFVTDAIIENIQTTEFEV